MVEVRPATGVGSEGRFSNRVLVESEGASRSAVPRDSFISVPSQLITTQRVANDTEDEDQVKKALMVAGVAVAGAAAIAGAYLLLRRIDPAAVSGGLKGLIQGIATLHPGAIAPLFKPLALGVSVVSTALLLGHFISTDPVEGRSFSASYRFRTETVSFSQPIFFSEKPVASVSKTEMIEVSAQREKKGVTVQASPNLRSLSGLARPTIERKASAPQVSLAGRGGAIEPLLKTSPLMRELPFRDLTPVTTWVMTSQRNPEIQALSPESVPVQRAMSREAQLSRHRSSIGSLRTSFVAENGGRSRDQKGGEGRLPERERVADLIRRGSGSYLVTVPSRGVETDHSVFASPFSPLVAATSLLGRRPETAEISALTTHQVVLVSKGETAPLLANQIKGRPVGKSGGSIGSVKRLVGSKGLFETGHPLEDLAPTVLFSPPELAPRLVYSPLDLEAIRMPPGTDFSPQLEKVALVTEYELSLDETSEDQPEIPESEEMAEATQEEGDGSRRQQNGEEEAGEEEASLLASH